MLTATAYAGTLTHCRLAKNSSVWCFLWLKTIEDLCHQPLVAEEQKLTGFVLSRRANTAERRTRRHQPKFIGTNWNNFWILSKGKCLKTWWPGTELNRRRQPFQGCALPPELPGHVRNPARCGLRGMCASRCLWREYHSSETFSVTEAYGTVSIITTAFTSLNRLSPQPPSRLAAPGSLIET